jgi:hypothetical protein
MTSLRSVPASTLTNVDYLNSLPDELLLPILQTLPLQDLGRLCRVSNRLTDLCRDWNFWADRARREFNVPRNEFRKTTLMSPQERYVEVEQIYQARQAEKEAADAVTAGNHNQLLTALQHLSPRFTNLSEFITELLAIAAKRGDVSSLGSLIDFAQERLNWNVDLQPALDNAETTGNYPVYEVLERQQQDQLNHFLHQAARNGDIRRAESLIRSGATDLNGALLEGICSLPMVMYLIDEGANNLGEAFDRAKDAGCDDVIKYLGHIY